MDEDTVDNVEDIQETVDEPEPSDSSSDEQTEEQTEPENEDGDEQTEEQPQPEIHENGAKQSPETSKPPELDIHRKSTLLELDSKHSWLSALEEKCIDLENAFISKIQYVAVSNHCQQFLDELDGDETAAKLRAVFANLFDKFQTAFVGSQRLLNKLNETKAVKAITDSENRKIKVRLEDREEMIEDLKYRLESQQNEVLKLEQEVISLKDWISERKSKDDGANGLQHQDGKSKRILDDNEAESAIRKLEEANSLLEHKLELAHQREDDNKSMLQKVYAENNSLKKAAASTGQQFEQQVGKAKKAELMVANKEVELESRQDIIRALTDKMKDIEEKFGKTESDTMRWRIIEQTDPDRAGLVAKIISMQKQLFRVRAELQKKRLRVQEKEQLAQELQGKIKKQPDTANAREQLWACRKELGMKMERVKCLTAENSMFQSLCSKYEKEIMALRDRVSKYKMAEQRDRNSKIV